MVKQIAAMVVAVVVLGATAARAQVPPPSPDFRLIGTVDNVVSSLDGAPEFTRGGQAVLQGWMTECRSGLQPVTQRVGAVTVAYLDASGARAVADHVRVGNGYRPDAGAYAASVCPAAGGFIGFAVYADLPPSGVWTAYVTFATWDGAGRVTQQTYAAPGTMLVVRR